MEKHSHHALLILEAAGATYLEMALTVLCLSCSQGEGSSLGICRRAWMENVGQEWNMVPNHQHVQCPCGDIGPSLKKDRPHSEKDTVFVLFFQFISWPFSPWQRNSPCHGNGKRWQMTCSAEA